jgi:hypothetical protein
MSEKINVLIGANIEGLKTALAESGRSLSVFGTLAQQAPKKAKTAVDQLNQSYRDAVRDAKNLALMQGQTSEAFYEAQLRVKNLKSEIEGLNQIVGQTGQIAAGSGGVQQAVRGFDGLGNSVNQLTRELPAFTYSMQTGFMAVSNNIPMFVEQINNIKTANAALIAQGKPVQSVFSQLASSIFSWQTALSLGVTILTVYGEKIINLITGVKQTKEELDKLAKSQKEINDLRDKYLFTEEQIALRNEATDYNKLVEGIKAQLKAYEGMQDVQNLTLANAKAYRETKIRVNAELEAAEKAHLQKIADIRKSYATKDLKDLKNESFDLPNTPLILPIQPKFELAKLKADFKPIKLENFIDTTNAMTGFDRFKMNFLAALDDIEARVGKWSDLLANSLSTAISGAGSAFMSDDKDKWKNYGKMLLGLLGDIAIQIGGALMAMGIPMAAALIPMGFVYIASGSALLLAGGMLKAGSVPSQSNANSGGSQSNNSMSGNGGDIPSFNPTGMMISIDGMVRGNNIVVALDNQTRMNRRVR